MTQITSIKLGLIVMCVATGTIESGANASNRNQRKQQPGAPRPHLGTQRLERYSRLSANGDKFPAYTRIRMPEHTQG